MLLIFIFLTGFGLAVSGGVSIIAYMNFLPVGVTWGDYLLFMVERPECYFFPAGILLMSVSLWLYNSNL